MFSIYSFLRGLDIVVLWVPGEVEDAALLLTQPRADLPVLGRGEGSCRGRGKGNNKGQGSRVKG